MCLIFVVLNFDLLQVFQVALTEEGLYILLELTK